MGKLKTPETFWTDANGKYKTEYRNLLSLSYLHVQLWQLWNEAVKPMK